MDYQHWRGRFYPQGPPVKRWFDHYASVFDTVELNASFYRLPKPEAFAAWRDAAKGHRARGYVLFTARKAMLGSLQRREAARMARLDD